MLDKHVKLHASYARTVNIREELLSTGFYAFPSSDAKASVTHIAFTVVTA